MALTSRAVVAMGDGTWQLRDMSVPPVPDGGALLKVEATGLCHSDVDHINGIIHTPWGGAFPSIIGHEIVGRIVELGPAARGSWDVAVGGVVAVRSGVTSQAGMRIYGHDYAVGEGSGLYGGCAEYMELLPGTVVERLPPDIPPEELTIWEPLSIALGWAGHIRPGDSVAILGPGHLGLATIVAARSAGAEHVYVTGTAADSARLDAARRLGVDAAIDVSVVEDPVAEVRELSGGGVDVAIDAASGATVTVTQAMQMVRPRGTVVIGGLKDRKPVDGFISDWVPMRRLTITPGTEGDHVRKAVDMLWEGDVPTAALLGEVLPLDRMGEALALVDRKLEGRDAIRVVLRL